MIRVGNTLPKSVLKIFSYTAFATVVKMVASFLSLKIVANLVGAEGIVILGQLNNFSSIVLVLASGGIANGITKYVAERREDPEKVGSYISTAFQITLFFSLATALFLLLAAKFLSKRIILSDEYGYIFIIFAATIFFYSINGLFTSVINGFQDFRKYAYINVLNSITGLIFTLLLVVFWRMKGVLISAVTYQSVVLVFTLFIVYRFPWFRRIKLLFEIDRKIWGQFLRYSLMMFTTAATAPVAQLILRSMLVKDISIGQAALWEGINRISGAYTAVFVTSFSVYYLPKLSQISERNALKKEVLRAYRMVLPVIGGIFLLIYLLRGFIIQLLFTPSFMPMQSLFSWQLIGDFIKLSGWLIGFVMVAKTYTRYYVLTDVLFHLFYVLFAYFLINKFALDGIMMAYVFMYSFYLIFMVYFFRKCI